MEKLTTIQAIKRFFEAQPHGRTVTMDEFKALTKDERTALGMACGAALGVEVTVAGV